MKTMLTGRMTLPVLSLLMLLSGCSAFDTPFIRKHTAPNAKADAVRRWNDLRGNARLQLAQRHLEGGRLDEAERELDAAMATSPSGAAPYLLLTRIRLERGRLAEAREALAAARTRTDDPEVDYLEGIIEQRYGNTDAALIAYTHAVDKAPLVPDYVLARAEMLVTLGRPSVALELVTSRMRDFDHNVPMRSLAARIARTLEQKEPAIEFAREAARLSDNDSGMVAFWGNTLVWAGRFDEAVDALEPLAASYTKRKLDIDDERLDAAGRSAIAEFEDAAGSALSKDASDVMRVQAVIHDLARACVGANRHETALTILSPWVARNPQDLLTTVCVARAALALNDADRAARCLRRAHAGEARSPESMLLLAYAEFKLERFEEAATAARGAVGLDNRMSSGYCMLGRAEQAQGRVAEARAAYERALVVDPHSRAAAALLRRLESAAGEAPEIEIEAPVSASANKSASLEEPAVALRGRELCH